VVTISIESSVSLISTLRAAAVPAKVKAPARGIHPADDGGTPRGRDGRDNLNEVNIGLLYAGAAALCYGGGSIMQAIAARRNAVSAGVDPRLLVRLITQLPYLVGLGLDMLGFCFGVLALRLLPIYVVQAIVSANLAVTALLAGVVFGLRLSAPEWGSILAICFGLSMLGLSAGHEGARDNPLAVRAGLLAGAVVVGVIALVLVRSGRRAPSVLLGGVAGLGFGTVALAARTIPTPSPAHLIVDPAAYALLIGALVGALFFATALQRGRVTTVVASVVVGETVIPAVVGVAALGDTIRPATAPVAIAGFVVAICGVLSLVHYGGTGELPQEQARQPDAAALGVEPGSHRPVM
jgi:drug/metabolite transporter (DMT)-like permease